MIIGNFKKTSEGTFTGVIRTLTIDREVTVAPVTEKKGAKSPDYRLTTGQTGIGAAWKETSAANNSYLSVQLEDPAFPATIFCALVKTEQGYALVWSRSKRKRDGQTTPAGTEF